MAVQQRFDGYGSHIPVLETITAPKFALQSYA